MNPEPTGLDVLNVLASILTPILSFIACLIGSFVAIRSDNRQQAWRQREERLQVARWTIELAISTDPRTRAAGEAALDALTDSSLVHEEYRDLVLRIANKLPTDDRLHPPYAESAEPEDVAQSSDTERSKETSHERD